VLVVNAPYVPTSEIALMPAEARDHEPRVALDGGADGLDVVRRALASAPEWLRPGGRLLVETSEEQAPHAAAAASGHGLVPRVASSEELDATVVIAAKPSTALLVIDMQEDVLVGCPDPDDVIARINELSRRAAQAGVPVIFIQQADDELVEGTPGWEIAAALERPDGSVVVAKNYRDAFEATQLPDLLGRLGATRLVVTGAHSDWCVQTTTLSALVRGYDIVLVSDAHTSRPSPEDPALTGEALTALVNSRMATLRYPERTIEVLPAAEVEL
jgi:nicotinamidase-related amidase